METFAGAMDGAEAERDPKSRIRARGLRATSPEVQRLLDRLGALEEPRGARLARARHMLVTGKLDAAEVLEETARRIPGIRTWVTNEYQHNGLRADGEKVLDRLLRMRRGEI